jgi:GNAT superfamily N-acetyltransferase
MRYWVAHSQSEIVGYILWLEKGGFRSESVIELEQIAVRATWRHGGVGSLLARRSAAAIERVLLREGRTLKLVEITTGSEQGAVHFYYNSLGARPVARISNFFRGDEIVLISRSPFPWNDRH